MTESMNELTVSRTVRILILLNVALLFGFIGAWMIMQSSHADSVQLSQAEPGNEMLTTLGKGIYDQHCASCHGVNLEGEPNWWKQKPDGKMPAPPHDQTGHTWHHSDKVLFDLTKHGLAALIGSDYPTDMPIYAEILSDEEIWAVLVYIKSTWPAEIQEIQSQIK